MRRSEACKARVTCKHVQEPAMLWACPSPAPAQIPRARVRLSALAIQPTCHVGLRQIASILHAVVHTGGFYPAREFVAILKEHKD